MLHFGEPNRFHFVVDNWHATSPSNTNGTSVTPGASNVWGAWTEVLSDTVVTTDCYLMEITVLSGVTAGQDKSQLFDIGIDAAGGTTYVSLIGETTAQGSAATKGIPCGNSNAPVTGGQPRGFAFPLRIPSGAAVAVRVQGSNATAGTVRVMVRLYGKPSNPSAVYAGQAIETVGAITNSGGVTVAPGNASWSAWTSLGTTSRACKWWQLAVQLSDNDQQAANYYFELGTGAGASGDTHIILRDGCNTTTGEIQVAFATPGVHAMPYCPVPAGATMYVRGLCNVPPDTTWTAVAVGVT